MGKVAIVTGSNKGIGFAIVRGLCKQFDGDVYLTARDESRGKAAVEALNKEGLHPKFHQLDIENTDSVQKLKQHLTDTYGGLDILVNNAGFAYKAAATEPFAQQAEDSVNINYFGTLNVINGLMPLLNAGARMSNVSSMASSSAMKACSAEQKSKLLALTSVDDVSLAMKQFISDAKAGTASKEGWAQSCYGMSKVGMSLLTPILQALLSADSSKPDRIVNACCPGYVDTDMTSHKGHKTIDQGADTPLYLALLPANTQHPKGEFVSSRKITDWSN